MATTFSNPKEMLGYKIIQDLQNAPEILKSAPYDRKAAYAYYYVLRHLHSQMISFHSDMFVIGEDGVKYTHEQAYPAIITEIKNNWATVYSNQQDLLLEALFKFSELIASSFPKLGLVPESGEAIEEERIISPGLENNGEEEQYEPIQQNQSNQPESYSETESNYSEPQYVEPEPEQPSQNIAQQPASTPSPNSVQRQSSPIQDSSAESRPSPIFRKPTGYRFT